MSRLTQAHRSIAAIVRQTGLAVGLAALALTTAAQAQVHVDGQDSGVVVQAQPVQRTYSQVYSASNRARLITKQSVMSNGGTLPPVQQTVYVQQASNTIVGSPAGPSSDDKAFRLNPYARRRYTNYSYYNYRYYGPYYGNYGYFGWYAYQYYPGFYYYWRPSSYRFSYPYRSYHGYYDCGPSHYGGSHFRYSSSGGLSLHVQF